MWIGVGYPCPPVRNDIVTPRYLLKPESMMPTSHYVIPASFTLRHCECGLGPFYYPFTPFDANGRAISYFPSVVPCQPCQPGPFQPPLTPRYFRCRRRLSPFHPSFNPAYGYGNENSEYFTSSFLALAIADIDAELV